MDTLITPWGVPWGVQSDMKSPWDIPYGVSYGIIGFLWDMGCPMGHPMRCPTGIKVMYITRLPPLTPRRCGSLTRVTKSYLLALGTTLSRCEPSRMCWSSDAARCTTWETWYVVRTQVTDLERTDKQEIFDCNNGFRGLRSLTSWPDETFTGIDLAIESTYCRPPLCMRTNHSKRSCRETSQLEVET